MKISILAAATLCTILSALTIALPQSDLDKLDEKFTRHIEKVMPGWKHERVEPIVPTENVLIQFWSASERKVKISIMPHSSGAEARTAIENFVKYERNKETLKDIGEEAYAWGYGFSDVVFRKGRYTIFVSTTADIGARPEERTLSQAERFDLMRSEMRRWSMQFAKHAATALDSP
jgi:hypothetical protein